MRDNWRKLRQGRAFGKWRYMREHIPGWHHGIIKCIKSPELLGFYQNLMSDIISFLKSFSVLQLEGAISPCIMLQLLPSWVWCVFHSIPHSAFLCSQYCLAWTLSSWDQACSLLLFLPHVTPNTVSDTIITWSIVVVLWMQWQGCQASPESHWIAFGQGY